jgi:hypothetical protein
MMLLHLWGQDGNAPAPLPFDPVFIHMGALFLAWYLIDVWRKR